MADYAGEERRSYGKALIAVEVAFDQKLHDHELRMQQRLDQLLKDFEIDAFPDGTQSHRAAHQAMIDAAKQEAEFWRSLKVEMAKKSIWGILQILSILLIAGIAAKFGLGALMAGGMK